MKTELTEIELRRAFARSWRHRWPADYELAMNDPVIRSIVETVARHVPTLQRQIERERRGVVEGANRAIPALSAIEQWLDTRPASRHRAASTSRRPLTPFLSGKDRAAGEKPEPNED